MKIATWNVNSLKVRLPHVLDWLATTQADVLCLQETKMEDKAFPYGELEAAGYRAAHNGQKTYNGVAILAREGLEDVRFDIPGFADEQRRLLAATVKGTRVVCAYMPNGQAVGSDKYDYKLRWLAALAAFLREELQRFPQLALLGDYNIAPEDRDVHDPRRLEGPDPVHANPERAAFRQFLDLGLADAFRLFAQPEKIYSWSGLPADRGSASIAACASTTSCCRRRSPRRCRTCIIDKAPRKLERPSDHAPVVATLEAVAT